MKKILLAVVLFAFVSSARAGNDALSQASSAPLGERVANYLQTMMMVKTAIWEQNRPVDMDYREEIHMAVSYEPSEKLIGVSVIGVQDDSNYVKSLLERIRKTMLSFDKKLKNDYGVELTESDFSLAYLNVRSGKIILRLKETEVGEPTPSVTPEAEPPQTPNASAPQTP